MCRIELSQPSCWRGQDYVDTRRAKDPGPGIPPAFLDLWTNLTEHAVTELRQTHNFHFDHQQALDQLHPYSNWIHSASSQNPPELTCCDQNLAAGGCGVGHSSFIDCGLGATPSRSQSGRWLVAGTDVDLPAQSDRLHAVDLQPSQVQGTRPHRSEIRTPAA